MRQPTGAFPGSGECPASRRVAGGWYRRRARDTSCAQDRAFPGELETAGPSRNGTFRLPLTAPEFFGAPVRPESPGRPDRVGCPTPVPDVPHEPHADTIAGE